MSWTINYFNQIRVLDYSDFPNCFFKFQEDISYVIALRRCCAWVFLELHGMMLDEVSNILSRRFDI